MKFLHTGLSPNVESDDVMLATSLFFRPWTWRYGDAVQQLKKHVSEWLPARHVFPCANGRTALLMCLQALNLKRDDEVLLQAFTCVAVPEPIVWVGAKPVFVDIDSQTLCMSVEDLEKKISSKSKVLILQHTFGNPSDLVKIKALTQAHGIVLIEDCAHALGGTFQGRNLGTFGDVAFFSFGRDKMLSSVFGGILATNDDVLGEKLRDYAQKLKMPSSLWIARQLVHPLLTSIAKAMYGFFGAGRVLMGVYRKLRIISLAVDPMEKRGERPAFIGKSFSNALACLALHQFQKLERYTLHRKGIARFYDARLSAFFSRVRAGDEGCTWLRFPVRLKHPQQLLTAAYARGMVFGDWYTTPIAPIGVDVQRIGYVPGSCPNAERVSTEIVNLPTHIGITERDAEHIVSFMNAYGAEHPGDSIA